MQEKLYLANEQRRDLSSFLPSETSTSLKLLTMLNKPFDHQYDFASLVTKLTRVACLPGLLPGILLLLATGENFSWVRLRA